jgi:hypothetical protein
MFSEMFAPQFSQHVSPQKRGLLGLYSVFLLPQNGQANNVFPLSVFWSLIVSFPGRQRVTPGVGHHMQYVPVSFFQCAPYAISTVPTFDAKVRAGGVVLGLVKDVVTVETDVPSNRIQGVSFRSASGKS